MIKLTEILYEELVTEDLYDFIKQELAEKELIGVRGDRLKMINLSKSIMNIVKNAYNRLGIVQAQIKVVPEIMKEVGFNSFKATHGTELSKNLGEMAKEAIIEYREGAANLPELPAVIESYITVSTLAGFMLGSVRGLGKVLDGIKGIAKFYQLEKLQRGLEIGNEVMGEFESPNAKAILDDKSSYKLYLALWNRGFQTSKTILPDYEYLKNKFNAKEVCEGVMGKLMIAYYSFGALMTLLSICAALMKRAEGQEESRVAIEKIHGELTGKVEEGTIHSRRDLLREVERIEDVPGYTADYTGDIQASSLMPSIEGTTGEKVGKTAIGYGGSRTVYPLGSGNVIKMARDEIGILQNKNEVSVFGKNKGNDLLAQIYKYDTGELSKRPFSWIVMERGTPLSNASEFEALSGVDFNSFCFVLQHFKVQDRMSEYDLNKAIEEMKSRLPSTKQKQYIEKALEVFGNENSPGKALMKKLMPLLGQRVFGKSLHIDDLQKLDSWGKSQHGKLILLDYGADIELMDTIDQHIRMQALAQGRSVPSRSMDNPTKPAGRPRIVAYN
jgi:hypothetical protein